MPLKNDRGFSLIEVLVAMTILAIGLLALAGLQVTSMKGNLHGGTISQATALAEEQIEIYRNESYANVVNIAPTVIDTIFTRTTLIEDNIPLSDLKRVTVTVSWTLSNKTHQVQLRTIVSNEG
jgi:type IV pilus assembly protein PilV